MSSPNKLTLNVKQHKDHQTAAPTFTSIFKKQITSNNSSLNKSLLSSSNNAQTIPSTVSLDIRNLSATKPINTNRYTIAFAAQENVEQFYQNLKLETLNSVCLFKV